MGMQGFDQEEFSAPMAEINTTPLVDVMLVLLVIFLVTAPMLTQVIKIELPNEIATEISDKNPIAISVTQQGEYYWNSKPVSEIELEHRLNKLAAEKTKQAIHLYADKNVTHGKVSKVLALAQQLGLSNIGFVTSPK